MVAATSSCPSDAWQTVFLAMLPTIRRCALSAFRNLRGDNLDDAVQEAFMKLARRKDVANDPSALSWLMSVVRNACRRLLRPLQRDRRALGARIDEVEALGVASDALDPQHALARWELVHAVHAAIAALERPYREVLVMRDLEGLSGEETCVALGLEASAMKTR